MDLTPAQALTKIPVIGKASGTKKYANRGNFLHWPVPLTAAFTLGAGSLNDLVPEKWTIPYLGYFEVEGMYYKGVTATSVWTTTEPAIGIVASGGTPGTGAIASHTFAQSIAVDQYAVGTYSAALSFATIKRKISGMTEYQFGISQAAAGGIVAGKASLIGLLLSPCMNVEQQA